MAYTIGQVAERAGMTVEGLRFYERRGLLEPMGRTPGGYRLYGEAEVETLEFIRAAQRMGFSLAEIRELVDLRRGGRGSCEHVRDRLREKLAAVRERQRLLATFAGQLDEAIARCDEELNRGDSPCCPVLDQLGRGLEIDKPGETDTAL